MGINTRRTDAPALPPLQLQLPLSSSSSSQQPQQQLYPPTLSSPFPSRQPSRQGSICSFTTASSPSASRCSSSYGSRRGSEMALSPFPPFLPPQLAASFSSSTGGLNAHYAAAAHGGFNSSSSSAEMTTGNNDDDEEPPRTPLPFGSLSSPSPFGPPGSLLGGGALPYHLGPGSSSSSNGGWTSSCSSNATFAWATLGGGGAGAGGSRSSSASGATTPVMPSTPAAVASSSADGRAAFAFGDDDDDLGPLMLVSASGQDDDGKANGAAAAAMSLRTAEDDGAQGLKQPQHLFASAQPPQTNTTTTTTTFSAAGPIRARRSSMSGGGRPSGINSSGGGGGGKSTSSAGEPEWTEREEGILQSFLMHPLRPLGAAGGGSSSSASSTGSSSRSTAAAAAGGGAGARRTMTTLYAPGELPPPEALDELATQVMQYHSCAPYMRSNASPSAMAAMNGSGPSNTSAGHSRSTASMSSSASVPLGLGGQRTSSAPGGGGHRRTHSASGIPWRHTWKQTRKKLFEIARKEAMGLGREDRWKDREASRLRGLSSALFISTSVKPSGGDDDARESGARQPQQLAWDPPALTPTTASMNAYDFEIASSARTSVSTPKASASSSSSANAALIPAAVRDVPGGATLIRTRDGALRMQRQGSAMMLEIPEASALDEEIGSSTAAPTAIATAGPSSGKQRLGQVLRLSTSLQRSARANGNPSSSTSTLEPNPITPTNGTFPRPTSLLQRGRSFTADDFESHMASLMTPSQETDAASAMDVDEIDPLEVAMQRSLDTTPTKARPMLEQSSLPCGLSPATTDDGSLGPNTPEDVAQCLTSGINIVETPCSPSPSTGRRGAGNVAPPHSPHLQLSSKMNIGESAAIDDTPRPCLIRSFSAATGESTGKPSAFAQFMQGAAKPAAASDKLACTANGFDLPPLVSPTVTDFPKPEFPFAKRQRYNLALEAPNKLPWPSMDGGLRSPFDEGFGKHL